MPPNAERGIPSLRRAIARWQTWWVRLFILMVVVMSAAPVPRPWAAACMLIPLLLFCVRPPAQRRDPVTVHVPVRGRWISFNSPGSRVPSHRVRAHGQMYAVDLIQDTQDTAEGAMEEATGQAPSLGWSLRGSTPEEYPSYGAPVFAMASGTVVHVTDHLRDHRARDSWPTLIWMMTLEGFLRVLGGVRSILGNRVIIRHDDGRYAAYVHLRRDSATVRPGDRVDTGQQLGQVGNTGNTSEPHLHVQLMDRPRPESAAGLPMRWSGVDIDTERLSQRWATGYAKPSAVPDFPANGQIFQAIAPQDQRVH
ncbi:M23 family metallopeptidase [Citricoccus muralis]|uniref:Peptidase M23-like protein n=1 Tax=Citricoccus muralis TaxID=169134 RepID=A0A3D9LC13_9MICC|nr:M23 family metallopeptidase [Citricoccus muralis]REE03692.1 peptidase M23-like protein [Citricoccus muralis]